MHLNNPTIYKLILWICHFYYTLEQIFQANIINGKVEITSAEENNMNRQRERKFERRNASAKAIVLYVTYKQSNNAKKKIREWKFS